MSWSPRQQAIYRALVRRAWAVHCGVQNPLDPQIKKMERKWYEAELEKCLGVKSTADVVDRTRSFEFVMAHFEILARDGIYWQTRLAGGDVRRARVALDRFCRANGIEASYVQGVARQMFSRVVNDLNAAQLIKVLCALDTHLNRGDIKTHHRYHQKRQGMPACALEPEPVPVGADVGAIAGECDPF